MHADFNIFQSRKSGKQSLENIPVNWTSGFGKSEFLERVQTCKQHEWSLAAGGRNGDLCLCNKDGSNKADISKMKDILLH